MLFLVSIYLILLLFFILLLSAFPHSVFSFHGVPHSLSLPLSSCLSFILLLIGLPFIRGLLMKMFFLLYAY